MLNLYCYSDKIIYQTSNESDFALFEQQAICEGLDVIISEFFPYEISDDGKILFDENKNPVPLSRESKIKKGISNLETEKERIKNLINIHNTSAKVGFF